MKPLLIRSCALTIFILSWITQSAAEPELDQQAAALSSLRERIGAIENKINADETNLGEAQRALRVQEVAIAEATGRLNAIESAIALKLVHLSDLKHDEINNAIELTEQRNSLQQQIRAAYMMGRSDFLKLLLNQQDPSRLGRVLVFHRYFTDARARQIKSVVTKLQRLQQFKRAIKLETNKLSRLRADSRRELETVELARQARHGIVTGLQGRIAQQSNLLGTLRVDEERLQALVRELEDALAASAAPLAAVAPFDELEGQLAWPTEGEITRTFGALREDGAFRWQGVMLEAQAGIPVRAISPGRVIFADWFRHLGLLIILDHGGGYMSLYGHNQTLFNAVGDWVEANEIIAAVGDSGGRNTTGLYFEIRRAGVPQNPARWCETSDNAS